MLCFGPDGADRVGNFCVECAIGHADMVRAHLKGPVKRRSAGWAKEVLERTAGISFAAPGRRSTCDRHLRFLEICARPKGGACPLLARAAVAGDHKIRIAFETGGKVTALTCGLVHCHEGLLNLFERGCHMSDDRKTILITGCSSGIGYDCAHGLAKAGWRVFATCRNAKDCERLESEGLESFVLDYEDQISMDAAVAEVLSRTGGTLDALFNNGAYAVPGFAEDLPVAALRANFEVNFFAQHELTRMLIPTFRAQGHGHILMNSSVLGFAALRARASYNSTKFAMEGWADTLRLEMKGTGIHVVLIQPGPITSDIRVNSQKHFEKWIDHENSARAGAYQKALLPRLYAEAGKPDPFELPASAVTKVVIRALEAKNPRPRYRITTPTKVFWILKRILPNRWLDSLLIRA